MADESKIKERIRKALALSENAGATEAERAQALATASSLMTNHQIQRSTLDLGEARQERITERTFEHVAPYTVEKSLLLGRVADALGLGIVHWGTGKTTVRTVVYGFESDLELLDMIYTSLLLQQAHEFKRAEIPRYLFGARVAAWRRDWMTGFAYTASKRVREAHRREVEKFDSDQAASGGSASGAELALTGRREAVTAHLKARYPGLKSRKPRSLYHDDAVGQGGAAGLRTDVGATRVGENRRQLGR